MFEDLKLSIHMDLDSLQHNTYYFKFSALFLCYELNNTELSCWFYEDIWYYRMMRGTTNRLSRTILVLDTVTFLASSEFHMNLITHLQAETFPLAMNISITNDGMVFKCE